MTWLASCGFTSFAGLVVNLEIPEKSAFAWVPPPGTIKSTLLRQIKRLVEPTPGLYVTNSLNVR